MSKRPVPDRPVAEAIVVRDAVPADHDALRRVTLAAYRSIPGYVAIPGYEAALGDVASRAAQGRVMVAVTGEGEREIVGGVTYVDDHTSPLHDWGEGVPGFRFLAVSSESQGRGAGRALVAACEELASAGGYPVLALYSAAWMSSAHHLYEAMGYLRRPDKDWRVSDEMLLLRFEKQLGTPNANAASAVGS
jgi:GNAT superfamily N-acetyltransferase